MARLSGQFVGEPIEVEVDSLSPVALARGEPSAPHAFRWRGERYVVERVLDKWRRLGVDRGESYVREHCFQVRTTDGTVAVLSCDRRPRRNRNPWRIVTVTAASEQ